MEPEGPLRELLITYNDPDWKWCGDTNELFAREFQVKHGVLPEDASICIFCPISNLEADKDHCIAIEADTIFKRWASGVLSKVIDAIPFEMCMHLCHKSPTIKLIVCLFAKIMPKIMPKSVPKATPKKQ